MKFVNVFFFLVVALFSVSHSQNCMYDCAGTCNGTAVPDCLGDCGGDCTGDGKCEMLMGSCDMDKFVVLAGRVSEFGPPLTSCEDRITYAACVKTAGDIAVGGVNSTCA